MEQDQEENPNTEDTRDIGSGIKEELEALKLNDDQVKDETTIKVHPLTNDPTKLYEKLSVLKKWKDNFKKLKPVTECTEKEEGHIRFVCISDTHTKHNKVKLPEGDVLLHAGDFTFEGSEREIIEFCSFLEKIKTSFKHIVVIAGNHELSLDETMIKGGCFSGKLRGKTDHRKSDDLKELLNKHCIFLEDEDVELFGIKIYGTPWQPWHRGWAFNIHRGENILERWKKIPNDTDILLVHGPPLGHGDLTKHNVRAGCAELLSTIQERVKPKVTVFGHIHEGYGVTTDGTTTFVNASVCNQRYLPTNKPIIIDLPGREQP